MKPKKRLTVCKSNALIKALHQDLTLGEQKLFLTLLSMVDSRKPLTPYDEFELTVNSLADLTGAKANNAYRDMQTNVKLLKNRTITIELEPNTSTKLPKEIDTSWVANCEYYPKEGRVVARFDLLFIPHISELSARFTQYKLEYVAKMQSSYGIRLYEILAQWGFSGERELAIDDCKTMLGISGKYTAIKDFKKRVITPAVNDINSYSNLDLKIGWVKRGRRITAIQLKFSIKGAEEKQKIGNQKQKNESRVLGVPRARIEKEARPGETAEDVARRILKAARGTQADLNL